MSKEEELVEMIDKLPTNSRILKLEQGWPNPKPYYTISLTGWHRGRRLASGEDLHSTLTKALKKIDNHE